MNTVLNQPFFQVTLPLMVTFIATVWAATWSQNKRFEDLRADMNRRFDEFRVEMDRRFEEFRGDINRRFDEVLARLDRIEANQSDHA